MKKPTAPQDRFDQLAGLLAVVEGLTQPADQALSQAFRSNKRLGARDRHFLAESVYAYLRNLSSVERLLSDSGFQRGQPSYTRRRAYMAAALGMGYDRMTSELSEGERAWLTGQLATLAGLPSPQRQSLPEWIYEDWVAQLGDREARAMADATMQPASLDLRVNILKAGREELIADLREAGIRAKALPELPEALRVEGKPSLSRHPAFVLGAFEVQDLGSQLLARLASPKRGAFVVDFCAGAGGKTLALGALMRNSGRLYALDRSAPRLARLKPRLARSGLSNVWPIAITGLADDRLKRLRGKAHIVLVDAPCTGLGTLRRNPDLKWRQKPEGLASVLALQAQILDAAVRLLAPGGRLVYATCSTRREENEGQVEALLARNPGLERLSARDILESQGLRLPEAWNAFTPGPNEDLRLWTHRTGTDAFYGAVLVRRDAAAAGANDDALTGAKDAADARIELLDLDDGGLVAAGDGGEGIALADDVDEPTRAAGSIGGEEAGSRE